MNNLSDKKHKQFKVTITEESESSLPSRDYQEVVEEARENKRDWPFTSISVQLPKELHKKVSHVLIDEELTWQQVIETILTRWMKNPRMFDNE